METENKNHCVNLATHVLRRKLKKDLKLFRNGSVHKFYRLKALITLEQVNTSIVKKSTKKKKKKKRADDVSLCERSLVMTILGDPLK